ncbi:MAG: hypothetical protein U0793_08805 [Gemmataceae bacterium]
MLSEDEIKRALRASRVTAMPIANPHGPLGWGHLAHTLAGFLNAVQKTKVVKSMELPVDTWEKLEQLADEATRSQSRPVSVSEVTSAILQHYVAGNR